MYILYIQCYKTFSKAALFKSNTSRSSFRSGLFFCPKMWNEVKEVGNIILDTKKVLRIVLSIKKYSEFIQRSTTLCCYTVIFLCSVWQREHEITDPLKELWEAHIQSFLLMNSRPIIISPLYSPITGFRICCIVNKTVCSGVSSFSLMEMAILHCSEVTVTCPPPERCWCLRDLWRAGGVQTLTQLHPGNRLPW